MNVFDLAHLQGVSPELLQSMVKVSRKGAELEVSKLQIEIRKEQSEQRWVRAENRRMAAKGPEKSGGKDGAVKNLKRPKKDNDDEKEVEDLQQLMEEEQDKPTK